MELSICVRPRQLSDHILDFAEARQCLPAKDRRLTCHERLVEGSYPSRDGEGEPRAEGAWWVGVLAKAIREVADRAGFTVLSRPEDFRESLERGGGAKRPLLYRHMPRMRAPMSMRGASSTRRGAARRRRPGAHGEEREQRIGDEAGARGVEVAVAATPPRCWCT